jgi:hypothetical protein
MIESKISEDLYREFHQFSRKLTYATIGLVAIVAFAVWLFKIDVGGNRTTAMGAMFMLLALFTYKIPHISYKYLLNKYKNDTIKRNAIGYDWKQFRDIAMQRRY